MLMWTGKSQGVAGATAQRPEGDEHQVMCLHIHLGLVREGLWEQGRDSPPLAVNEGPEKTPGTGNRLFGA